MNQTITMNPPYSLKYNPESLTDNLRGSRFGMPPASKADYLFLVDGLLRLEDGDKAVFLFPHGVLFRGAGEKKIRQKYIDENLLDAVIGLPPKLFSATDIPTVAMVFIKDRKRDDIFFIDASETCNKMPKKNIMTEEHVNEILEIYKLRRSVERYASVVTKEQIIENDYNLNIPRYVDTFIPEPPVDVFKLMKEIEELDVEIAKTEGEISKHVGDLVSEDIDTQNELKAIRDMFSKRAIPKLFEEEITEPTQLNFLDGLPSMEAQGKIIRSLDAAEMRMKQEEEQIEKLKELKRYFMNKMFI